MHVLPRPKERGKRKEGEPGIQCHVTYIGQYARVGRVADCENCIRASKIFENSSLIRVKA